MTILILSTLPLPLPLYFTSCSQLNATLQPLRCFDNNMLKMLPAELIAFGKLLPAATATSSAGGGGGGSTPSAANRPAQLQRPPVGGATDVLQISVNGLHRWTPQFENHIWKHLGKRPLPVSWLQALKTKFGFQF